MLLLHVIKGQSILASGRWPDGLRWLSTENVVQGQKHSTAGDGGELAMLEWLG